MKLIKNSNITYNKKINKNYTNKYNEFISYLEKNSIENRPIITGNFARQPYFIENNYNINPLDYPNADYIHFNGLYIGLSCSMLSVG